MVSTGRWMRLGREVCVASGKVSVDPGRLRACAEVLSQVREDAVRGPVGGRAVGSVAAVEAVDGFAEYWGSGVSVVGDTVAALAAALDSAVDVYERRDAQDVWSFEVVSRAV